MYRKYYYIRLEKCRKALTEKAVSASTVQNETQHSSRICGEISAAAEVVLDRCSCRGECAREHTGPCPNRIGQLAAGSRNPARFILAANDIKDMSIHIHQAKTGKRLAIEITPDLEKVLDRCWQLPNGGCDGGAYVITRKCGGRFTSEGFRSRWQSTMNRWCRRGGTRFTFHDLRALAATRCPTIEHAMYLLGHSNISMTRRVYRRGIERVKPVPLSAAMSA